MHLRRGIELTYEPSDRAATATCPRQSRELRVALRHRSSFLALLPGQHSFPLAQWKAPNAARLPAASKKPGSVRTYRPGWGPRLLEKARPGGAAQREGAQAQQ